MKIKTSELIGPTLDCAVAKCEGISVSNSKQEHGFIETAWDKITKWEHACEIYNPSADWSQGGPIIAREKICLSGPFVVDNDDGYTISIHDDWSANIRDISGQMGPTPLIAAMRCYVASLLGDEVEVPDELV